MPASQDKLSTLSTTLAWRFAGLVQQRLAHPIGETVIAVPESPTLGPQDWNGGVFTYVAPNGNQVRVGRTRNGVDRGGKTWVDFSQDGGKTWQRKTAITKDDETSGGRAIASVERPYVYGKSVDGELWVVLGTCAAEKGSKCWDIHEREAPLAHLEQLKDAPVCVVLRGDATYAYKDGVPLQSPDGTGRYLSATRHHLSGPPQTAVNADTVLCKLDETTGSYQIIAVPLPRGARGDLDKTCNRLSCELVLPDGTRFWSCDIRNNEEPNAAVKTPLQPGDPRRWKLGDFDEITSFAVGMWEKGDIAPQVTSVPAILGRSTHPPYPALRYLGIVPLLSPAEFEELAASPLVAPGKEHEAALLLTYEKASSTGSKSTYQQTIFRKELAQALLGKGPELLVGQDPVAASAQPSQPRSSWGKAN